MAKMAARCRNLSTSHALRWEKSRPCERVESIQKCPADAPAEAVIHPFLSLLDVFAARQSHGSPLSIFLTANSWKVPRKNTKKWVSKFSRILLSKNGCPSSFQVLFKKWVSKFFPKNGCPSSLSKFSSSKNGCPSSLSKFSSSKNGCPSSLPSSLSSSKNGCPSSLSKFSPKFYYPSPIQVLQTEGSAPACCESPWRRPQAFEGRL